MTKYINGVEHIKEQRDNRGAMLSYCEWYYGTKQHQLRMKMDFKDNKMHGMCISWHEDGILASVKNYINGQLNGPLTEWDTDGSVIKRITYDRDKPVNAHGWTGMRHVPNICLAPERYRCNCYSYCGNRALQRSLNGSLPH